LVEEISYADDEVAKVGKWYLIAERSSPEHPHIFVAYL